VADAIHIQVNGEIRAWRRDGTVADLLQELDIHMERVAVELNLHIIDRAALGEQRLQDGDRVEILTFIGGGTRAFGPEVVRLS
jgi:sulfur carrier protein